MNILMSYFDLSILTRFHIVNLFSWCNSMVQIGTLTKALDKTGTGAKIANFPIYSRKYLLCHSLEAFQRFQWVPQQMLSCKITIIFSIFALTLKVPIRTTAGDKFCDIFPNFRKNKAWYYMRIVCQQMIFMKYHALFVIFEKPAKFEIVVCCKLLVALYGLKKKRLLVLWDLATYSLILIRQTQSLHILTDCLLMPMYCLIGLLWTFHKMHLQICEKSSCNS